MKKTEIGGVFVGTPQINMINGLRLIARVTPLEQWQKLALVPWK